MDIARLKGLRGKIPGSVLGVLYEWSKDGLRESLAEVMALRSQLGDYKSLISAYVAHPVCERCHDKLHQGQRQFTPNISKVNWTGDLLQLGVHQNEIVALEEAIADGVDSVVRGPYCYGCRTPLPYWESEDAACIVITEPLKNFIGFRGKDSNGGIPDYLRQLVLDVYGEQCFSCYRTKAEAKITIDHINPQVAGGQADLYNLQPLCEACNQMKNDGKPEIIPYVFYFPLRPLPSDAYEDQMW